MTDKTGFISLRERRLRGSFITVFPSPKIGAGRVEVLSARLHGGWRRGNGNSCFRRNSVLEIRKNSSTMQTTNHWNSLPRAVVKSPLLEKFKIWLDRAPITWSKPRLPTKDWMKWSPACFAMILHEMWTVGLVIV